MTDKGDDRQMKHRSPPLVCRAIAVASLCRPGAGTWLRCLSTAMLIPLPRRRRLYLRLTTALVAASLPIGLPVGAMAQQSVDTSETVIGTGGGTQASPWAIGNSLAVGDTGTGALAISAGGAVSNTWGAVGYHSGSNGAVTVDGAGSSWANSSYLILGYSGAGTLAVSAGGVVSNNEGAIGLLSGSTGSVTVDGTGSRWTNSVDLVVGQAGTGTLAISAGGAVSDPNGYIGLNTGSTGMVTVDGSGSSWTNTGNLYVGNSGTGTLAISTGGLVGDSNGYLGYGSGSIGTATVDGAGSSWTNSDNLTVGNSGTGTLAISTGGTVSDSNGVIGYNAGSTGTATVDGTGSSWSNSGYLTVGRSGTGALAITAGGLVSNASGVIGFQSGSTGAVTVEGAGSRWTNSSQLLVGENGTGTLAISAGGLVSDPNGFIGIYAGSTGTVTVDGTGSSWANSGSLYVGHFSTGTLALSAGGTVSDTDGNIGRFSGSTGTVTVDGAGSAWTNSNNLYVGNLGTGTLAISSGGTVSNTLGYIGYGTGSTGTVTVDGAGSSWTNSGELDVGFSGTGALAISAGGVVSNTWSTIGYNSGSNGAVTVDGAGSNWTNSGSSLSVGGLGAGALTVTAGGTVNNTTGLIGESDGSTGTVMVDGTGSSWRNLGNLAIGDSGTGTLAISSGGLVSNNYGYIGYGSTATGTATVAGAGSSWTNSGKLYVGDFGTGTLAISASGAVRAGSVFVANDAGATGTVNIGAASGDTAVGAGTLTTPTLAFGAGTGTLVFNHTDTGYDFGAAISGSGTILHQAGVTNLTGNSSGFTGTTTVSGGLLNVDSTLGGTLVLAGGKLGGNGTLGTLNVTSGTLAPGHSVGTLNATNISFGAASTYAVELKDGGFVAGTNNDFINATGTITLAGGTVTVAPENGTDDGSSYSEGTYTIASAAGGVTGTFASLTDSFLFLDFGLSYDATSVFLTSTRVADFASAAKTANQSAAAGAADNLARGNSLRGALLAVSTNAQAQAAYDALSGEGYATMASGFLQTSRYPREAMLGQEGGDGLNRWASAYGGMISLGSDGNAATAQLYSGGLMTGMDQRFGDAWLGGAIQAGFTRLSVADRATAITSSDLGAGIYGGTAGAGFDLSFGADYTLHQITSTRNVTIGGFSDTLTASYTGGTAQVFGEIRHSFDLGTTTLTPFAGAAWIYDWTQGFSETGGAAALSVAAKSNTAIITTLGATMEHELSLNGQTATLSGTLGWRHAFGATPSLSANLPGGTSFTTSGAPIARDALMLGAGLSFDLAPGAALDLNYSGEIGSTGSDHKLAAALKMSF